jgi:hypothetical protein
MRKKINDLQMYPVRWLMSPERIEFHQNRREICEKHHCVCLNSQRIKQSQQYQIINIDGVCIYDGP